MRKADCKIHIDKLKWLLILIPLAILVHNAAGGRFRTFRPFRDDRYNSELAAAAEAEDWGEVRRLLRMGADVNAPMSLGTLLHQAFFVFAFPRPQQEKDLLPFLLERGVDPNAKDGSR